MDSNTIPRLGFLSRSRFRIVLSVLGASVVAILGWQMAETIRQQRREATVVRMLTARGAFVSHRPTLLSEFDSSFRGPVFAVHASNSAISDADLKLLKYLPQLEQLHLSKTAVTDLGMAHVAALTRLENLELAHTSVSDKGLGALRGLPRLRAMHLDGTLVTNGGLQHLAKMQALTDVTLNCPGVTDDGVDQFRPLCAHFIRIHR